MFLLFRPAFNPPFCFGCFVLSLAVSRFPGFGFETFGFAGRSSLGFNRVSLLVGLIFSWFSYLGGIRDGSNLLAAARCGD